MSLPVLTKGGSVSVNAALTQQIIFANGRMASIQLVIYLYKVITTYLYKVITTYLYKVIITYLCKVIITYLYKVIITSLLVKQYSDTYHSRCYHHSQCNGATCSQCHHPDNTISSHDYHPHSLSKCSTTCPCTFTLSHLNRCSKCSNSSQHQHQQPHQHTN